MWVKVSPKAASLKPGQESCASAADEPHSPADTNSRSRIYERKLKNLPQDGDWDRPPGFVLPVFALSRRPNGQEPLVFTCRGLEEECAGEVASAWTFFLAWMLFPILGGGRPGAPTGGLTSRRLATLHQCSFPGVKTHPESEAARLS